LIKLFFLKEKFGYDYEADILYVAFNEPKEAICLEPEEGIILRVDMDAGTMVGYTIIGFLSRLKANKDLTIPFFSEEEIAAELSFIKENN